MIFAVITERENYAYENNLNSTWKHFAFCSDYNVFGYTQLWLRSCDFHISVFLFLIYVRWFNYR